MRSRVIWLCLAMVAVVAVAAWLRLSSDARHAQVPEEATATAAVTQGSVPGAPNARTARLARNGNRSALAQATAESALGAQSSNVEQPEQIGLQVDASGALVKNSQTRDEMERIFVAGPAELEARRQEILDALPPAAAREALDLLERFGNYRQALQQAIPDTVLVLTEQDALVMLDTAHALRVTYFGAEMAEALFGEEEAIGRGTAEGSLNAGSDTR